MEPRPYSPAPLESRSLLVLHATVTGTSTDVAERIARRGRREGWSVAVKGAGEFNRVSSFLSIHHDGVIRKTHLPRSLLWGRQNY